MLLRFPVIAHLWWEYHKMTFMCLELLVIEALKIYIDVLVYFWQWCFYDWCKNKMRTRVNALAVNVSRDIMTSEHSERFYKYETESYIHYILHVWKNTFYCNYFHNLLQTSLAIQEHNNIEFIYIIEFMLFVF